MSDYDMAKQLYEALAKLVNAMGKYGSAEERARAHSSAESLCKKARQYFSENPRG